MPTTHASDRAEFRHGNHSLEVIVEVTRRRGHMGCHSMTLATKFHPARIARPSDMVNVNTSGLGPSDIDPKTRHANSSSFSIPWPTAEH